MQPSSTGIIHGYTCTMSRYLFSKMRTVNIGTPRAHTVLWLKMHHNWICATRTEYCRTYCYSKYLNTSVVLLELIVNIESNIRLLKTPKSCKPYPAPNWISRLLSVVDHSQAILAVIIILRSWIDSFSEKITPSECLDCLCTISNGNYRTRFTIRYSLHIIHFQDYIGITC